MNGKVLLWVIVFVAWLIGGSWWWACPIWENCADVPEEAHSADISAMDLPPKDRNLSTGPLTFTWGNAGPQTSQLFPAFRDSLVRLLAANQKLEIVGTYYAREATPAGFDNLGVARATEITELFIKAGLDSSRIVIGSMLNPEDPEPIQEQFVASVFNRKIFSETIEEGVGKDFTIFFPFASNQMNNDPAFGQKLDEAAAYLKGSGRKVILTGHTDAKGTTEANETRGLDRANSIREELIRRGVAISQIETRTMGERELRFPNQPDADQNRRVEVHFPN